MCRWAVSSTTNERMIMMNSYVMTIFYQARQQLKKDKTEAYSRPDEDLSIIVEQTYE